jgi:hypothetical protein
VPANYGHASLRGFCSAATQHLGEDLRWEISGNGCNVERRNWSAAHRVDVAEGVRSGDCSVCERVIDYWGEEIYCQHQRQIVRDAINPRVVGRVEANDDVWVIN